MTIRNPEGGIIQDRALGVPGRDDDRLSGSPDRILHLLGIDTCVDVFVTSAGVFAVDCEENQIGLKGAVEHVYGPDYPDKDFDEVRDRLMRTLPGVAREVVRG